MLATFCNGMRKFIFGGLVCLFSASQLQAGIIYEVDRRLLSGGSAFGTIETDGTLGTLSASNIVDWNLKISRSFNLFDILDDTNSTFSITGTGLSASNTALLFDFDSPTGTEVEIRETGGLPNAQTHWTLAAGPGTFPDGTGRESIYVSGGLTSPASFGLEQITISASVEEPPTLVLFLLMLFSLNAFRISWVSAITYRWRYSS